MNYQIFYKNTRDCILQKVSEVSETLDNARTRLKNFKIQKYSLKDSAKQVGPLNLIVVYIFYIFEIPDSWKHQWKE